MSLLLTLSIFHTYSSVFFVNFEHVIAGLESFESIKTAFIKWKIKKCKGILKQGAKFKLQNVSVEKVENLMKYRDTSQTTRTDQVLTSSLKDEVLFNI